MQEVDRIAELSSYFTSLADADFAGYSPLYERLSRQLAGSPEALSFIDEAAAPNARRGRVPVLFLAALHDLALRDTDADLTALFAGEPVDDARLSRTLARSLDEHGDLLRSSMRARSVQTNEVGRSAAIVAALAGLDTGGRSVALIELGPSAGLNLFADRWHIDWRRDGAVVATSGPEKATVRLDCELRGPLTPPCGPLPEISLRTGVDPSPIDVTDPDDARWLRACVWPGVTDRAHRLAAAIDTVVADPPALVRGDAVTDLAPLVAAAPVGSYCVVVSTWAMAYLSNDAREVVIAALDDLGATRDLAFIALEEPRFLPWAGTVDSFEWAGGDGTPTMLARRRWHDGQCSSRRLALCHPHVRWMHWLEEGDR